MTKCLLVYAHCDDELLWGHPWLLDRSLERSVLICCSDRLNPARQSYRRGEEALAAVCADVGVTEHRVLSDYFSEFYRLRTRGAGDGPLLKDWWRDAQAAVREMMVGCDFIVSHNPWGEYGHLDHVLVRRMVIETEGSPVLHWTTARVETSTWPVGQHSLQGHYRWFTGTDHDEFSRLKEHYVSRDCWTWSSAEPKDVYLAKDDPCTMLEQ